MKELTAKGVADAIDCPMLDHFPDDVPIGTTIRRKDLRGRPNENKFVYIGVRGAPNLIGAPQTRRPVWRRISWREKPLSYYDALN